MSVPPDPHRSRTLQRPSSTRGLNIANASGSEGEVLGPGLQRRGGDHRLSHRRGLSLRSYPKDCPPLKVQWFHAVDVPKRKPKLLRGVPTKATEAPAPQPKKFAPFSKHDSRSIEAAFQKLVEREEGLSGFRPQIVEPDNTGDISAAKPRSNVPKEQSSDPTRVFVNEDFLFDVNIEDRELEPAYWLGPVYEVRRGTWFQQDGSTQKPVDENLANQLEEGYIKSAPWTYPPPRSASHARSASNPRARPKSMVEVHQASGSGSPKLSSPDLAQRDSKTSKDAEVDKRERQVSDPVPPNTHRLFGPYSNSVVTYQDINTAYVLTDDFMSRMTGNVYQRFAGGSHYAGNKFTRGYTAPEKKAEVKDEKSEVPAKNETKGGKPDVKVKTEPSDFDGNLANKTNILSPASEEKRRTLERHMSSLTVSAEEQEEEVRKRDEREIQDDYKDKEDEEQNRPIEHLLLVTHGIGQRMGLRMETVNFIHDVNTLRKTLKSVYGKSPDLQALNAEVDSLPKNCRVQALPINWRHKLDFPRTSLKHNKKEFDLSDVYDEENGYPNLDDITVDGVPAVRGLITDLALDILLYQSPIYRQHITRIVVEECNRIYKLFSERNPGFDGKVSLVGHSLGSALMWDILCSQAQDRSKPVSRRSGDRELQFDFEIEDFYALGSPIGLFQMLQGRTVAARKPHEATVSTLVDRARSNTAAKAAEGVEGSDVHVSAPKCKQVFNIFHPTDPISYRLEPLISPAMSSMKPQPLPYTKRGIFGAQVQGLSGIGTRVGQSVAGLWSSFSSGIASSLVNRSLGISADNEKALTAQSLASKSSAPLSLSGTNTPPPDVSKEEGETTLKQGEDGEHPPTLLDGELETLYAGFQRRRRSEKPEAAKSLAQTAEWEEAENRARKLKQEEAKVRALNSNGRVDYSIQEGAFDISLIAAVASHLSYWADEDVGHFIISQLLSRQRVLKRTQPRSS